MGLKEPYPLQKVTILLRRGDAAWLSIYHGKKGMSKVIRDLVIRHIDRVNEAVKEAEKDE